MKAIYDIDPRKQRGKLQQPEIRPKEYTSKKIRWKWKMNESVGQTEHGTHETERETRGSHGRDRM